MVAAIARIMADIRPGDDREAADLRWAVAWLERTDDIFRRVKPSTPDPHLVSYVVPIDPDAGDLLLGEHLNAGLWLPPGGHVEVGEHPSTTASREAMEELGVDASGRLGDDPVFLSVTETVGIDSGHTDVSLWYVLALRRDTPIFADPAEFHSVRWWSPTELRSGSGFDPALGRFLVKVGL
jgi:8-oxo-dGTP diphosphatase